MENNKEEKVQINFETLVYNFGEVQPNDVVDFSFKCDDTDKIDSINSCGCTEIVLEPTELKGKLDIRSAGHNSGIINKVINVYLKDGQPYEIIDEKKRRNKNPLKGQVRLTLTGSVNLDK